MSGLANFPPVTKDNEWNEEIPLQDFSVPKRDNESGQENRPDKTNSEVHIFDNAVAGPSYLASAPQLEPPLPPPPPPLQISLDEDSKNVSLNVRQQRLVTNSCSLYYLFYVTVIQPFIKTVFCIIVIYIDIKSDNACQLEQCRKPVYTFDGAVYYMICLGLFSLSAIHLCIGSALFTKRNMLTRTAVKTPIIFFVFLIVLELFMLILVIFVTNASIGIWILSMLVIFSEVVGGFILYYYPNSIYTALDNENSATRIQMMVASLDGRWRSVDW